MGDPTHATKYWLDPTLVKREGPKHKQNPTNLIPGPQITPNSKTQKGHGRENFV